MQSFNELSITVKIYFVFLIFALGAIFGSFCNAWAWRIVHKENIARGRSHCAKCGHILAGTDLVPIFSYIILKGRCRYCKEKISPRYLIVEILFAVYFLSIVFCKGFSLTSVRLLILGCILLVASLVDIDIMELPDGLMIAGAVAAFIRLFEGDGIVTILLGIIPAVSLFIIVIIMDKVMKRETMGGGDIKLMAVLGLHFGIAGSVFILIAACILGLVSAVITKRGKGIEFPFGPMLSAAAWVTAIVGTQIINAYLSLF